MEKKILFYDDYSEGAHPRIIEALAESNLVQESGYGSDSICLEAASLIKEKINNPNTEVHFVSGGTQANLICASAMLRPHESMMAAESAHICVHEAGAIEATGHKINPIKTHDGKITSEKIQEVLDSHYDEHMVKPKCVLISNSTEVGTVYTKAEIEKLSSYCKQKDLYFYLDGARIGSALTSHLSDLSLEDLSRLTDIFYIGGTKNGALLGEAIVINNPELQKEFRFHIKQKGGLMAKGRVLGVQFRELFKDDLFFDLAKHANNMANLLASGIKDCGHELQNEPQSNMIMPILPRSLIEKLNQKYGFYTWTPIDEERAAVRLVTSWATSEETVEAFVSDL